MAQGTPSNERIQVVVEDLQVGRADDLADTRAERGNAGLQHLAALGGQNAGACSSQEPMGSLVDHMPGHGRVRGHGVLAPQEVNVVRQISAERPGVVRRWGGERASARSPRGGGGALLQQGEDFHRFSCFHPPGRPSAIGHVGASALDSEPAVRLRRLRSIPMWLTEVHIDSPAAPLSGPTISWPSPGHNSDYLSLKSLISLPTITFRREERGGTTKGEGRGRMKRVAAFLNYSSEEEEEEVSQQQVRAVLLASPPETFWKDLRRVVSPWAQFYRREVSEAMVGVLRRFDGPVWEGVMVPIDALVRRKVNLGCMPKFSLLNTYYEAVPDEAEEPGCGKDRCTQAALAPPVGQMQMQVVLQLLSVPVEVPSDLKNLIRNDLKAAICLGATRARTANNLLAAACDAGKLGQENFTANLQRHLILAGMPVTSRYVDGDFAESNPTTIWRLWVVMVNLSNSWKAHHALGDLEEWLSPSGEMGSVVSGTDVLPPHAYFHAGFAVGKIPTVAQLQVFFDIGLFHTSPGAAEKKKNRSYLNLNGVVFSPDNERFSIILDSALNASYRAAPALQTMALHAALPTRPTMAGTMNTILSSLVYQCDERNNKAFAKDMVHFLLQIGIPDDYPTFIELDAVDCAAGESLNVLWRLFNIVLEFPDKFQIDTSAHIRAMRKRAKAHYVQDRYAPAAPARAPISGQGTPEATVPPKGQACQDIQLTLRQRRARGPKP